MFLMVSEFFWKIFLIISLSNYTYGLDSEPHYTPGKDSEPHYTSGKDSEPHYTPGKDSEPYSEDRNSNQSQFHSILYNEIPLTKEKGNHTNSEMLENPFECECGAGDYGETLESDISLHQEYSFAPITNRIVNGYNAKQKPWMLFLHIKSRFDESVSTSCGATILNPRWAITAAHCLCSPSHLRTGLSCERKDGVTRAMYKPYDPNLGFDMFVYFGTSAIHFILNGNERDVRKFRLSLKKVLIHPGYLLSSGDISDVGADVALIQTRRSIPFSESVSPICLPGPTFRDEEIDAFIVGYGRTSDDFCMTTGEGPEPFKQCRSLALVSVPYKYENGYKPEPFSGCSFLPTPQSFNPRCSLSMIETALNQSGMSWDQDVTRNGFVTLEYNGVNSTCYRNTPSLENHGWCGVCDTRALDPEDENSCENEETYTPKLESGWGFCSYSCSSTEIGIGRSLQETTIRAYSNEQCFKINKEKLNFNPKTEICGAHIWKRKSIHIKQIKNKKRKKSYEATKMVTEITGATDACQGDSGGPLVTLQDPSRPNKTVLIGVISRGEGCAMNGFTATYTRVSAFYNWIVDSIQEEDDKYWKCKK